MSMDDHAKKTLAIEIFTMGLAALVSAGLLTVEQAQKVNLMAENFAVITCPPQEQVDEVAQKLLSSLN